MNDANEEVVGLLRELVASNKAILAELKQMNAVAPLASNARLWLESIPVLKVGKGADGDRPKKRQRVESEDEEEKNEEEKEEEKEEEEGEKGKDGDKAE